MRRLLIFSVAVSSDGIQLVRAHSLIPVFVPTSVVNWYLNQNKFFKFGWYIFLIWYI